MYACVCVCKYIFALLTRFSVIFLLLSQIEFIYLFESFGEEKKEKEEKEKAYLLIKFTNLKKIFLLFIIEINK